jgi:type II secretory pathway pseudopilin PulG
MELLLVMAIIVALAAVAAPSFRGAMRNISLKSAVSEVRAEMTKAHVLAMKSGRTQVFQYELGGSKYKLEPWIDGSEAVEGQGNDPAAVATRQPGAGADPDLLPGERRLPEGTKFTVGDSAIESRSQRIEQELGSAGANWSRPILFFPDGSSVDAFLVIGNEFDAGIRLDLRGMTAAVKVGDVGSLQALEYAQPASR